MPSGIDETIWPLDQHTAAKHEILRNYLAGWFPILANTSGRIVYIDGFAGPGIYEGGEDGSPVIALKTACEHVLRDRFKEVVFVFIENRKDRADKLNEILGKLPNIPKNFSYEVISGDFETVISPLLDGIEKDGKNLAPTFAFIDPFGYTGFSMSLLRRILSYPKCEVFITFMSGFIKRFLDESKEEALDELFGTPEWRKIRSVEGYRDDALLELYKTQVKAVCDAKYVKSFEMIGEKGATIYHLIFCTNHVKGLEVMKTAMWKVDERGQYKFSDRLGASQSFIFNFSDPDFWIPRAAKLVCEQFKGQTVPIEDIRNYVWVETNFPYRSAIMKYVEDNHHVKIIVEGRKRKGSFPDGCEITFP